MLLKLDAVRIVEDQHGMHAVRADDLLLADEVILSADLPQRFLFDLRRKGGDILPGGEDPLGNIVHEGYGAAVEHDDTLVDKGGCGAKIAKVLLFLPADGENTESLIDRTLQSELASLGGKDWVVDLSADALSQRAAADCGIKPLVLAAVDLIYDVILCPERVDYDFIKSQCTAHLSCMIGCSITLLHQCADPSAVHAGATERVDNIHTAWFCADKNNITEVFLDQVGYCTTCDDDIRRTLGVET